MVGGGGGGRWGREEKVHNNLSLALSLMVFLFHLLLCETRTENKVQKEKEKKKRKKPLYKKCMPYISDDPSKSKDTSVSQVLRRGTVRGKTSPKRMNFRYVKEVFS